MEYGLMTVSERALFRVGLKLWRDRQKRYQKGSNEARPSPKGRAGLAGRGKASEATAK